MAKAYACEVLYRSRLALGSAAVRKVQVSADSPEEASDIARRMFEVSNFEAEVVGVVDIDISRESLHSFGGAIGLDEETPAFCGACGGPLTAAHACPAVPGGSGAAGV